ncbi:MAG: 3-hydroxybutyryl-CoA dehydrogenase [Clostridiales bacterium]|jgi:3-hydroxybutyryl-CoA dehydrogenase|nr:3-hydroxybutyryl-CoA dehydrogenase [Clostridiales bacterium]
MKVFIADAGTMGSGIAQVFAQAGHDAALYDIKDEYLNRGFAGLEKSLGKLVDKGKMTGDAKAGILGRITKTTDINDAAGCGLALEAIIENMDAKKALFAQLDRICGPETVFASNTSSISITELAGQVSNPGRFIGMHFFNPAAVMKLVEVIRGYLTSDETFEKVFKLSQELGKEPVEVNEAPGFVVNKILVPMINEAVCVLEQGIAAAADIDKAMCLGAGHPMGPLALSDLIGNDVVLNIMDTLLNETGDTKYRASALLRKTVRAGKLGRKTGAGFFEYS